MPPMPVALIVILVTAAAGMLLPSAASAQTARLEGIVRDASGAVIPGATVIVRTPAGIEQQTFTGPDGRFTIPRVASGQATLVIRAGGFAEREQPIPEGGEIEVVLVPARITETVTVTPTRTEQRLGDVPASVSIIDKETIRRSPAVVADDVLRLVPTFSLFRRTSSLSAHPTAQGVSLRGIGPSGVSRSLVLIDGVPFNDPFGGWVYWTRIPLESLERIEVVDGASSSVYGNYAMGGVINIVSTRPRPRTFELRTQYGTRDSRKADFFASDVWGRVGASLEGSLFGTDGFPQVVASERGQVDTKAKADYENVGLKVDVAASERVNLFFRAGYFREERDNAKVTTVGPRRPEANDTLWKSATGGARLTLPDYSDLQARVFLDFTRFDSNFMAVPAAPVPRSIGRMTLLQRVPTTGIGGVVQWTKAISTRHLFSAGTDFRYVEGASHEQPLDPATGTTVTINRETGGTQMSTGTFAQAHVWPASRLSLTFSGRIDHWRNYDARHNEFSAVTGAPTASHRGALPDKEDTVFSPRVGALYHLTDRASVWGSLGWGFRAPTLNELYRQFSVGNIVTLANPELKPERLVGSELGVNLAPLAALTLRATWFDNRVKDPISNVTLLNVANRRQRQNLGRTRIRGFQTDVEYRFASDWRVSAGYVFNRARVRENALSAEQVGQVLPQPELVGKFLPQVPENRGSVSLSYSSPRYLTATVNVIFVGDQFDDDLNTLVLPAYGVVELSVSRAVARNVDLFLTAQNLFDKEYYVQRNPTTVGAPRLVSGGIRLRVAGR